MAGFTKVIRREGEGEFKYIAVGQAFEKMFKDPIEGKYLHEVYDSWIRRNVLQSYRLCVNSNKVIYNKKGFSTIIGNVGYEYILFPFMSQGQGKPDYIASCLMPLGVKIDDYKGLDKLVSNTPWL